MNNSMGTHSSFEAMAEILKEKDGLGQKDFLKTPSTKMKRKIKRGSGVSDVKTRSRAPGIFQ